MSKKMAHERLSAKKRVKSSELRELKAKKNPDQIYIEFGKHLGKKIRASELILTNPGYFYWAYSNGAFRQFNPWLEFQAWEIAEKAKHIIPPRKRPGDWAFDMTFDRHNQFLDFQIVKKSSAPNRDAIRVKHLDMSLVSLQRIKACKKLVERIREEFFSNKELTHWDYQDFFQNDRNFDLTCRETHCPKIPRRVVVHRKCPKYDGTYEG